MKSKNKNEAKLPAQELFEAFRDVLNSAYEADPAAMHALICNRVPCNQALAAHPTIPVDVNLVATGETYAVGMLGIVNGICEKVTGRRVAVMFSESQDEQGRRKIIGFTEYVPAVTEASSSEEHEDT